MEFWEVIKLFNEMCYDTPCKECPFHVDNSFAKDKCEYLWHEDPKKFEAMVKEWVDSRPIYPTIGDVVRKILELQGDKEILPFKDRFADYYEKVIFSKRLTRKSADYFGIPPINEKSED